MPVEESDLFPPFLAYYRAKQWAIFPVRGKVPLTLNGFKDASDDPEQWRRWMHEHPGCGWALPTGERNGIDALDADTAEAVAAIESKLGAGPRVRTGRGGVHYYLRHSLEARNWAKRLPGCDFRGEGGYVVLPGSFHENGQPYEWIEGTETLPIPATPPWLIALHRGLPPSSVGRARYFQGERNDRLFRLGCAVRAKDGNVAEEVARANVELCDPPLDSGEIREIVASVQRYVPGTASPTPESPAALFSAQGTPDKAAFVDGATAGFHFATLIDSEELLVYDAGCYTRGAETCVKAWVEEQFRTRGKTASSAFVSEVVAGITRRTYHSRNAFDPPRLACLANGILDLTNPTSPTLRPHDPQVRFTGSLPVFYDASATCPAFENFLEQILPSAPDRSEVRKLFGYCLLPGNPYQIAFMFIGEGSNGKSTLLGVLRGLLGDESVSAETLQTLVANRFAPASLWGKRANICADIPANPLPFTGVFKTLTGGDLVRAENKFGHPFKFVNGAKLIFSANELPEVNDRTLAFWRRWILLRFGEVFLGREDRGLAERLRGELPGILNWALQGIVDIERDGGFRRTQTSEDLALEWKRRADPVFWFVSARLDREPAAWISKEDLYEAFVQFCEVNGCSTKKVEVFGKLLPTHAPWVRTERRTVHGRVIRGWLGLGPKSGAEEEEPAQPAQPVTSRTDLTGWAGMTGSPSSVLERGGAGPDPGDVFEGKSTRAERAQDRLGSGKLTEADPTKQGSGGTGGSSP